MPHTSKLLILATKPLIRKRQGKHTQEHNLCVLCFKIEVTILSELHVTRLIQLYVFLKLGNKYAYVENKLILNADAQIDMLVNMSVKLHHSSNRMFARYKIKIVIFA